MQLEDKTEASTVFIVSFNGRFKASREATFEGSSGLKSEARRAQQADGMTWPAPSSE
jgi:hypothetical protein